MGPVVRGAPTILALETDSAWVVIVAVSLVTLVAAMVARRMIGHPGGLASGVLLTLPLITPVLAALFFERAVLPEVGVLRPFDPATMRGSSQLLNLLLMSDEGGRVLTPYALTGSAGRWLLLVGAAASSFMLLRRLAGAIMLRRLVARCTAPQASDAGQLCTVFESLARAAGLRRVPALLILPEGVSGAFAVGGREGKVLISRDVVAALDHEELDAILAHELAHLRALDVTVVRAAGFLRDLVAWNPVAHIAFRRLTASREDEADRRAAAITGRPLAVASGLLKLCALRRGRHGYAQRSALAAGGAGGSVTRRVTRLMALADGTGAVAVPAERSHPQPLPYVIAACVVAALGLQAGSRIADHSSGGIALVVGESKVGEDLWGPRRFPIVPRAGEAGRGEQRTRRSRARDPSLKLRYDPAYGIGLSVKQKDLPRWLASVTSLTAKRGIAIKTQWDSRQSWQAVPLISPLEGAPLGLYRIGQTPL